LLLKYYINSLLNESTAEIGMKNSIFFNWGLPKESAISKKKLVRANYGSVSLP
jgi:hypothetical protein